MSIQCKYSLLKALEELQQGTTYEKLLAEISETTSEKLKRILKYLALFGGAAVSLAFLQQLTLAADLEPTLDSLVEAQIVSIDEDGAYRLDDILVDHFRNSDDIGDYLDHALDHFIAWVGEHHASPESILEQIDPISQLLSLSKDKGFLQKFLLLAEPVVPVMSSIGWWDARSNLLNSMSEISSHPDNAPHNDAPHNVEGTDPLSPPPLPIPPSVLVSVGALVVVSGAVIYSRISSESIPDAPSAADPQTGLPSDADIEGILKEGNEWTWGSIEACNTSKIVFDQNNQYISTEYDEGAGSWFNSGAADISVFQVKDGGLILIDGRGEPAYPPVNFNIISASESQISLMHPNPDVGELVLANCSDQAAQPIDSSPVSNDIQAGTIEVGVRYPSDETPPMIVCAQSTSDYSSLSCATTERSGPTEAVIANLEVDPGEYFVFATSYTERTVGGDLFTLYHAEPGIDTAGPIPINVDADQRVTDVYTINEGLCFADPKPDYCLPLEELPVESDSTSLQQAFLTAEDSNSRINLRTLPSTTSERRDTGRVGERVYILQETSGGDGYTWLYVEFEASGVQGWVRSDFVSR